MDDSNLQKLTPCGKTLVAFFCIMVMVAMIWMSLLGMMESGMIGDMPSTIAQDGFSWSHFKANLSWSLSHLTTQALLYLAVGLLFMYSGYAPKLKKALFLTLGILIGLHVFGIAGYGFCWSANMLTYIPGPIIIALYFLMAAMILVDLKGKS